MKPKNKIATLTLIFVLCNTLSGCSSLHSKLRKAEMGTFKRQALSKFGEPIEKYRSNGKDHWVYETQKKSKHHNGPIVYSHTLIFEEGVMIHKKIQRSFTSKELEDHYNKD